MRLRRLDLTRYGKFTDRSLDFGARPDGGADFHIIYGPNEAGKSTTMQGWLDLLYGIPVQSRMDFLHAYGAMRLGVCIEADDGTPHDLIRTKGRAGTLTDPAGNPLPEAVVQGLLGGIDRAGYEAMFSLDDDTLEKGGESILSSQGDLGQMLFTASSGLAEMGQALDRLRTRAQGFFRPGARSGGLSDMKKELADLDQRILTLDTGARDYAVLVQERDAALTAWEAAEAEQDHTQRRLHQVERLLAALPLATRLRLLDADLADLPDLPPLPAGWAAELPGLLREHGQTVVRIEEQDRQIAAWREELTATVEDPDMLAQAEAMQAAETLKSDRDGAVRDLPNRRAEAAAFQGQIDDLLRQLGCAGRDPADLVLAAPLVARLRALMERHSGVAAALESAGAEVRAATIRLSELSAEVGGDGPAEADLALLDQVVKEQLRSDPEADLERAQAAHRAAQDRAGAAMARLAPWSGNGAALSALVLPAPDVLQAWKQDLSELRLGIARCRAGIEQVDDEAARIAVAADALAEPGQPSIEGAAVLRATRERLWSEHRATLTAESAERFEKALREDDQVTAALARAQAAAQQQAEARARLAMLAGQRARHEAGLEEALQSQARLRAALGAALPDGLDPATTVDGLEDWMRRREVALEAQEAARAAARDEVAARERLTALRNSLAAALSSCGQPVASDMPYPVLLARARLLLERGREQAAQAAARAASAAELARREAVLGQAQAAMDSWRADWREAVAQTGLGDAVQEVAAMREALELLQQLDRHLSDLRGLQHRIAKMQSNRAAFDRAVAELARALDLSEAATEGDAGAFWGLLRDRLHAAREGQARAAQLRGRIAEAARHVQDLRGALARLDARLEEMRDRFGCACAEDLSTAVAQAQRREDLGRLREQLVRDICEAMGTDQLHAAIAALEGLERPVLAAERDGLIAMQAQQAQALQGLYARLAQARAAMEAVGGDDAVAMLHAARQTLLLQIAEEARGFLRLRLGTMAVDHALQGYRETHRSAMMQRASEAFSTITRGGYSGLAAQPEGEREVLVAIAAGGGSKLARDLSKGTRFQLYLALRVAGYHEIAGTRATVPFIADDIMETFDDDRAAETFLLLAGMAGVGQVIYLTHHRHLCEIAQTVCPAVRIHALG